MGNLVNRFTKMHGLGNDFAIFDVREQQNPDISDKLIQKIADRKLGIGCDQVIFITSTFRPTADIGMKIYNANGNEVEACGNATRCVAHIIMREKNIKTLSIEVMNQELVCEKMSDGRIKVDMGKAQLDWRSIPLSKECNTNHIELDIVPNITGCAVNIGNPHIVFFVDDVEKVDLENIGPKIENHSLFPERTNVEFVQVLSETKLRMRVWERGVGITNACGSGACATLVAAFQQNHSQRKADIILDGGTLTIEYLENGHVEMTGPIASIYEANLDSSFFEI